VPDDSLMDRFDRSHVRSYRARDALIVVLVAAVVLVVLEGTSVLKAGRQLAPGVQRDALIAVGHPTSAIARALPLHAATTRLVAGLSPDSKLSGSGGFDQHGSQVVAGGVPQVTPDAFPASVIGGPAPPKRPLHTVLVTGDSLSTPLDLEIARRLAGSDVKVIRDPHLGAGISKTDLIDWGRLAVTQTQNDRPDAVVAFIGANEGFPLPGPSGTQLQCCGAAWAATYANRVRQVMNTYRRGGKALVYWLTVPTPREVARVRIERSVNAAVTVAAQPWAGQITVLDTIPIFTPGGRYRDSMPIGGRPTLVRESDGIHLNEAGSSLLAGVLLRAFHGAFTF